MRIKASPFFFSEMNFPIKYETAIIPDQKIKGLPKA